MIKAIGSLFREFYLWKTKGDENPEVFKKMIIANHDKVSESFKIKPTNLKWYAAFHNERHHPHIHMVLYSQDPKEGFLSDKGIENIKSLLRIICSKTNFVISIERLTWLKEK